MGDWGEMKDNIWNNIAMNGKNKIMCWQGGQKKATVWYPTI
jgi:hypothetical protein